MRARGRGEGEATAARARDRDGAAAGGGRRATAAARTPVARAHRVGVVRLVDRRPLRERHVVRVDHHGVGDRQRLPVDDDAHWRFGAAWRGGRRRAPAAHAPPGRPPPGRPPPGRPPREAGEAGGSRTAAARESNTPETLDTLMCWPREATRLQKPSLPLFWIELDVTLFLLLQAASSQWHVRGACPVKRVTHLSPGG